MGRKDGIIQDQLTENKGQVMDLQTSRIALGVTKGHKADDKRLNAGADAVGGNFQ